MPFGIPNLKCKVIHTRLDWKDESQHALNANEEVKNVKSLAKIWIIMQCFNTEEVQVSESFKGVQNRKPNIVTKMQLTVLAPA